MSRRTRTKIRRNQDHFGLGTSHHNEYASSNSYFPKSYSALGKEIKFPSTAVVFLSQGKLTFYGTYEFFQQKINKLNQQELYSIHTVNIGIKGKIQQKMSQLNNCIFAFSMILCCISQIFQLSYYRNKFYTKYSFELKIYLKIMNIFQKMPNIEQAMFTFQDNNLNENLSRLKLKSLTLRNLTYFIWPEAKICKLNGKINEFEYIKKTKTQFIFVWEKHVVRFNLIQQLEEQSESIVKSLCDEL